jgi:hypothetical protein
MKIGREDATVAIPQDSSLRQSVDGSAKAYG